MKTTLACVALAAAFVAGFLSGTDDGARANLAAVDFCEDRGRESFRIADVGAEIDAALAQRLDNLLAEIATLRATAPTAPAAVAVPAVAAAQDVTPQATPQFAIARALVDERLAYGTWTEEDRQAFRVAMQGLSAAEADNVLSTLFGAMNDGRIEVRMDGPPF